MFQHCFILKLFFPKENVVRIFASPWWILVVRSEKEHLLLHTGCCKTTLARAVAGTVQTTFTYLSGAQLHSMYVGEGEAALQAAFTTARASAPAVLFIDEVDSIAGDDIRYQTTVDFDFFSTPLLSHSLRTSSCCMAI